MELQNLLTNHEQRIRLSSKGTLQVTMPGGQPLTAEQHVVGHIPVGALIDGFQAWINPDELFGGDVTVSLGTEANPTLFFNAVALTDGGAISNGQDAPLEAYISNEPLVATISPVVGNADGVINFNVDYSEIDTKAGKYTY